MQALYLKLEQQATSLAFNDVFFLEAMILLALVGTVLIIRKPPKGTKTGFPSH